MQPCDSTAARAGTVWLMGLPGSGKSTLGDLLAAGLVAEGVPVMRLDGDALRSGLNADLGFLPADRRENLRRAAEVARLFNQAGLTVVASFITPLEDDRSCVRQIIGPPHFLEVFIDTPLALCELRDPKGMYRRARAGQIPLFTGVSAPFEPPADARTLRLSTAGASPLQSLSVLRQHLDRSGGLDLTR